jgi:hypothetical protein
LVRGGVFVELLLGGIDDDQVGASYRRADVALLEGDAGQLEDQAEVRGRTFERSGNQGIDLVVGDGLETGCCLNHGLNG